MEVEQVEDQFAQVAEKLINLLDRDEHLTLALRGESSQFLRINQSKVRQIGTVDDIVLTLQFIKGDRQSSLEIPFYANIKQDLPLGQKMIEELRSLVPRLGRDPFLVLPQSYGFSQVKHKGTLLPKEKVPEALLKHLSASDLVGFYAAGDLFRANINSAGQKHWFSTQTYCFDYSLFSELHPQQAAVKGRVGGTTWNQQNYQQKISQANEELNYLNQPLMNLPTGQYRVYLSPGAVNELLHILAWDTLSESSIQRGESCLSKMKFGERIFSEKFSLRENFSYGWKERFNTLGELAPDLLDLIQNGVWVNTLINARSAKEYQKLSNGANSEEHPQSPEILPGAMTPKEILGRLDTGLYITNLHYLNWSDRPNGRITGMTRNACFLVQKGKIVGPILPLRFDETLFHFFGKGLEDFTDFQEEWPEPHTYLYRQLGGRIVPGALVDNVTFTL